MQIPIQLPELHLPQATQREVQAVTPVTALAGLPELAESLSPHVALQWTQPVLPDQGAGLTRSAVHTAAFSDDTSPSPGLETAANSYEPASLTQWSQPGQLLTQLLKQIQSSSAFSTPTAWPASEPMPETSTATPSMPHVQAMMQNFQKLWTALSASDVFAARHLASHWFGATSNADPTQAGATTQRWLQALSPEHPAAQQATHMLMTGQMVWQGDLLPGIPMRIQREDSWRENTPGSGRLEKGAALSLDIELPQLGPLRITGQQWGDQLDVIVRVPRQGQALLRNAWPELEQRLVALSPGRITAHWQETE